MKNSDIICPIMSCRVTRLEEGSKTLTPTVVQCQKEQCAWWSNVDKGCVVHSVVGEMIKIGEKING